LALIKINKNPSQRELTQFAWLWLAFMIGLGGLLWWRSGNPLAARMLWPLAIIVPVVGWSWPAFTRVVYLGMCYAAYPIGLVVSTGLLAVVYFGVVTPIGVMMRLCGRDPLQRKLAPVPATYWIRRRGQRPVRDYVRQY